jgi:hypothetical protein
MGVPDGWDVLTVRAAEPLAPVDAATVNPTAYPDASVGNVTFWAAVP